MKEPEGAIQEPPGVASARTVVEPAHIAGIPVIGRGGGLTKIVFVVIQPVASV
jgi:hypothetical protein